MSSTSVPPFETILKLCLQASPDPWYPDEFASAMGIPSSRLEGPLAELRRVGYVEATDWREGHGQGYLLTPLGEKALNSPRAMAALRAGELPIFDRESTPINEVESTGSFRQRDAVKASLRNTARPIVTSIIVGVNLLLFGVAMYVTLKGNWGQGALKMFLIGGNADARHATGAITSGDLLAGDWWRLLAAQFVHQDFFHLLINVSTFLACARRAEQFWGPLRFALIYLISGLCGISLTLWYDPTLTVFGASGGICGTLLSVAAWFVLNKRHIPEDLRRGGVRQVLFAFGWYIAWAVLMNWFGAARYHPVMMAAGGAAGLLVAIGLHLQRFMPMPMNWAFASMVLLVPAASIGMLAWKAKDPNWRQEAVALRKARQKEDERQFFNKELSPAIHQARLFFKNDCQSALDVCQKDPKERKDIEIAQAHDVLRQGRATTDKALQAITEAGEFKSKLVADAVEAAQKYLQEQIKMINQAERCLEDHSEMSEELLDQIKKTERAMRAYDQL